MKNIYLSSILLGSIILIGCGDSSSSTEEESSYLTTSQENSENSNTSDKLDAYTIGGYSIGFDYERGTIASITFGCDGSFSFDLMLSGIVRNSMRGDDIIINNYTIQLVANSLEKLTISLDNEENIVKDYSKVTELDSYTINSIKQVSNCNE
jgi:hypothetical protein